MVAIVSGGSLGLNLTSSSILGENGVTGNAAVGSSGEQGYVNIANGNLVLQDRDDWVAGLGLDIATVRTYNSQGALDAANGNWHIGFYRSICNLTGTVNRDYSTVTRIAEDGSSTIYKWDSSTGKYYLNAEGDGAHDSLTFDSASGRWTWTDGSTRITETYDWANGRGKLLTQADRSNNKLNFFYDGSRLSEVAGQNGERTVLDYADGKLASVHSVDADGKAATRVRYAYDALGRLSVVTLDLSPDDNSVADGKVYLTTYGYDGDSQRIASIIQSDGTHLRFDYLEFNGAWRVHTLRQVVDGVERTTTYDYADQLNAVPTSVNVDGSKLSTVGDLSTNNSVPVDQGKLVTSETQTFDHTAASDSSKLVTNETVQEDRAAGLWVGYLSTTESQAGPKAAYVDHRQLSNTEPLDVDHTVNLDGGKLSTTDAPVKDRTADLEETRLTIRENQTTPASVNIDSSRLSTEGRQAASRDANVDPSKLATSGTQVNEHEASVDGGKLSTSEIRIDNRQATVDGSKLTASITQVYAHTLQIDGAKLSSTDTQVTHQSDQLDGSKLSTTDTSIVSRGTALDPATLATTSTVHTSHSVNVDASRLTTGAVQTVDRNAVLAGGALAVTDFQPVARSGNLITTQLSKVWSDTFTSYRDLEWKYTVSKKSGVASHLSERLSTIGFQTSEATANLSTIDFVTGTTNETYWLYERELPYVCSAEFSWDALTDALYGTTDPAVVAALQQALGNVDVHPGAVLSDFPTVLEFAVPSDEQYYQPEPGESWASIAMKLYGTDALEVASAVAAATDRDSGLVRAYFLPSTITYSIDMVDSPTTVPPYYEVREGDTWSSIAGALYGDSDLADTVMNAFGAVGLVPGVRLSNPPDQLSYELYLPVPVPTYVVPAGATWASVTKALYYSNPPEAIAALRAALGNPVLEAGAILTGLPLELEYSITYTFNERDPVYAVRDNDTWASIAIKLYGVSEADAASAGTALHEQLGQMQSLTWAPTLRNLPAKLDYTLWQPVASAPHYRIKTADTWGTIAATLYGSADAAAALQAALGDPPLNPGDKLLDLPSELTFTHEETIAASPYYTVNAGDSWASICSTLYGTNASEAIAALQAAMGNPALVAGEKLSALPATLTYTTSAEHTVPPYYAVQDGDTWTSIAAALYGTAEAAAALRTAMADQELAIGAHLSGLPSTLEYATRSVITVPAYYTVQAGDTWSSLRVGLGGRQCDRL